MKLNDEMTDMVQSIKMVDTSSLEHVKKISVSIPVQLLDEVRKYRDDHHYKSTNETIIKILQNYLNNQKEA